MPTKGQRCLEAVRRHLIATYGASTRGAWSKLLPEKLVEIIDTELAPKKRGPNSSSLQPDPEWLAAKKADPLNNGIDWPALDRRYELFCRDNKRRKSRKLYETFIRNADRYFDPKNGQAVKTYHELQGWRLLLQERQAEGLYTQGIPETWPELSEQTKRLVHDNKQRLPDMVKFAKEHPDEWKARIVAIGVRNDGGQT